MMKEKIIILTPVYNDWKNLAKLLSKTNKIFKKQLKTKFELVIVNDCSEEKYNFKKYKFSMVKKITILSLFKNVGSQRAIAIGIKYLSIYYKKKFKTIIMDSDGQDNPKIISKMLSASNTNSKFSIVIDRNQRKDPIWFKIFYELYCFLIKIFCAKKIRFGNFSLLSNEHLKKMSTKSDLWSAYPPTVSKNIKKLTYLTADREKRFGGKSKMSFFKLILHALKVFTVLKKKVLLFSILYFFISLLFFFNEKITYFYLINFGLIFINLSNFILSFNNKKNFLKNYKKIKIKII